MSLRSIIAGFLKPFIDKELEYIANDLAAAKDSLVAQAAASGQSAIAFIQSEVTALVSKNPLLSLVAQQLAPALEAYLQGLVSAGISDLPTIIDKVVAWIRAEEKVL